MWITARAESGPEAAAVEPAALRLVPFPKEVQGETGAFDLSRRLILEISQAQAELLREEVKAELQAAGYPAPTVRPLKTATSVLRLSTKPRVAVKKLPLREGATAEDYALQVQPNAITITGGGPAGLFYGVQTLRQLIRANRSNDRIPALGIRDWPSLAWRGFQDDLTRGPSSTLANLKQHSALGAALKLNLFTYYMEYQFAFQKHPEIGPTNGSLTADELREWVAFAQPRHLNVLGNQQSFGHFTAILAHPQYASLRETPYLLCPTNPKTYSLLDDLYSEVIPATPFPFFNVCCDETDGLGEGPSKALAEKIGVGGVYVEHIRRVYDLVHGKYGKRMMMWGDIILRHPEHLSKIPRDTVMLTWGYDARPSFEDQIIPFAKAGYDFFVCPGVSEWSRILPHFGVSVTNIQHFVRDGLKHGAVGMLNTAWDDDGESFNAPNWFGFAWGAECAWNGSTVCLPDFNRRLGAVLFGEKGDSFGQAISSLSTPGIDGLPNSAFWQFEFKPIKAHAPEVARGQWDASLAAVSAALSHLQECRKAARFNADLLDYYIYGARRIELSLRRERTRLEAALEYRNARRSPLPQALPMLERIEADLQADRNAHENLSHTFEELWRRENKTYAMDWTLARYTKLLATYDAELQKLSQARLNAKPDRSLPTPREIGLELLTD